MGTGRGYPFTGQFTVEEIRTAGGKFRRSDGNVWQKWQIAPNGVERLEALGKPPPVFGWRTNHRRRK
jgi:hypothetical protein